MTTITTYEIYFHGLICFYSEEERYGARDTKTEALIIVEDNYHTREIKTYQGTYGTGFNAISFNLDAGVATTSERFQEYVPHLGDLGVTRRNVRIQPYQAISLSLLTGELNTALQYDDKGRFVLDGYTSQRPVAKLSLLTVRTTEPLKISAMGNGSSDIVVVPPERPWALIFNGAPGCNETADHCSNHFQYYSQISGSGNPQDFATVYDAEGYPADKDDWGRWLKDVKDALAKYKPLAQPACSNSQWP